MLVKHYKKTCNWPGCENGTQANYCHEHTRFIKYRKQNWTIYNDTKPPIEWLHRPRRRPNWEAK